MIIDLRSDTVTKPNKPMLDAIMKAQVGDDVYKEDPTVNALEERVAEMFGKPKALFFPTGTMVNQVAIKLHTNPGEQVICHKDAHIFNFEGGGASFNSGVSCKLLEGENGKFTAKDVENAINSPDFYHSPLTTLVEVENTTNKGGGSCWDVDELRIIRRVCDAHGLGYHLDGARIWNALVAKNKDAKVYGELFDTISVCLSKGLGCPVGSVLIGDEALIKNAIRMRKILGGGMRQVGYLAAAGLYALDNNIKRLSEDHQKAKALGDLLKSMLYVKEVVPVETNIVIFKLNDGIDETAFKDYLQKNNILISGMGEGKLRLVTHLDYTDAMHERVIEVLGNWSMNN